MLDQLVQGQRSMQLSFVQTCAVSGVLRQILRNTTDNVKQFCLILTRDPAHVSMWGCYLISFACGYVK